MDFKVLVLSSVLIFYKYRSVVCIIYFIIYYYLTIYLSCNYFKANQVNNCKIFLFHFYLHYIYIFKKYFTLKNVVIF